MLVLLRRVNYGIIDKYCGLVDFRLTLHWEESMFQGKAHENGLSIVIDGVKENDDYEDGKMNPHTRSIKIDGDVKATLAAKPIKYLVKDL